MFKISELLQFSGPNAHDKQFLECHFSHQIITKLQRNLQNGQ